MGILFGILAALCWGTGDFLITNLTRRIGTPRAMVYIQACSLIGWIALLALYPSTPNNSASVWALVLAAGVCHVLGLVLTYRAFEIGTLSLVSPIASGFAIVTALLALVSGSEEPPILALGGTVMLVAGIVLVTRVQSHGAATTLAGVPEAIGCSIAFGTMFWMFDLYVAPSMGFVWPLIMLKSMALGSALMSLLIQGGRSSQAEEAQASRNGTGAALAAEPAFHVWGRHGGLWGLAVGVAATDILAWMAWNWGTETTYATIVTALASLFSVVTVLLAWVLLRERLATIQWTGVAVILLGIVLVSL